MGPSGPAVGPAVRLTAMTLRGALVAWLLFLACPAAWALDLAALEDPDHAATIDGVAAPDAAGRFAPLAEDRFEMRSSASAWWFRLRLGPGPEGRVLHLDGNWLDQVDFYQRSAAGWVATSTGDLQPVSARPIEATGFAFPLAASDAPQAVYMRIASEGILRTRFAVMDEAAFLAAEAQRAWIFGLFYAFVGALVLYHLLLYVAVRDTGYLGYVLYLGSVAVFLASGSGHAVLWLWPDWPWWGSVASSVMAPVALTGVLILTWSVCGGRALPRWMQRGFLVLGAANLALSPLVMIDMPTALAIGVPLQALAVCSLLVPMIWAHRDGNPSARSLLVGWLVLGPALLLWQASFRGLIAPSAWTQYTLYGCVGVQALIFSFALATRIRLDHERRLEAERRLAETRRALTGQLIEAQDAERRRIAGQLHDGLGQPLVVLSNRLEGRVGGTPDGEELVALSRTAIDDLRRISRGLHPHRLDLAGFAEAVPELVDESFRESGVRAELEMGELGPLPAATELHLYRILQEAFSNVLRHAQAQRVRVEVRDEAGAVSLSVQDDGVGGEPGTQPAGGVGTASIIERARALGGSARFLRPPEGGLRLEVEIPR